MKRYTDALNHVCFTSDEKQRLSERLAQAAAADTPPAPAVKRLRPHKLICAVAAATLAVTMLTAAAVPALGNTLREFFGIPVASYPVDQSITRDDWTFTAQECLADDNMLYISFSVQLPQTFPLDAWRYELTEKDLTPTPQDYYIEWDILPSQSDDSGTVPEWGLFDQTCTGWDEQTRTLQFVLTNQFYAGQGQSSAHLSNAKSFDLKIERIGFRSQDYDITLFADNFCPLTLSDIPIHPVETIYLTPNDEVPIFSGTSTLTSLSISPLFVTARVEGGSCYNHGWVVPTHPEYLLSEETHRLIAEGRLENTTCSADFDLHLKYKDGRVVFIGNSWSDTNKPDYQIVSTSGGGSSCEDGVVVDSDSHTKQPNGKATYATTNIRFAVPQDLDQIESIIVCGKEYPIHTAK